MAQRSDGERLLFGLRHLNELARRLVAEPSLDVLLVRIVEAGRELAGADFCAVLLLRPGTTAEVTHFVHDGPEELFPDRLPPVAGLLAAPVATGRVTRADDLRDHPALGIPVDHPPLAAVLAVPVRLEEAPAGVLVVANRVGGPPFDDVDEVMLTELARHAAVAVSLATARQAAARLDAARRALLDVALHNIRTPLTVARGFLSALRKHAERLGEEGRQDAFDAIERAHRRIQEMAEGALLDEAGRTSEEEPQPAPVAVAELLADLAAGAGEAVEIETAVADGAPATFEADPALVREALGHLVANAVQHSPPGAAVRVTARAEGASVRFDVADRGPGLAPEEQARVFEQHYRTRHSVEAGLPGSGLGLWTARRLVERQGGIVGVATRPGRGATFWATFPVTPPAVGGG